MLAGSGGMNGWWLLALVLLPLSGGAGNFAVPQLQDLSWRQVQHQSATAPSARYDSSLTASSGRLFLFGGFPLNREFWFFDLAKKSWTGPGHPLEGTPAWHAARLLPPAPWPSQRSGHVAMMAGDKLVIHGGWGVNATCPAAMCGKYSYLGDMWEIDLRALPAAYAWRRRLPASASAAWPPARWNHAAAITQTSAAGFGVAIQHAAYVYGGFDGKNSLADLWQLDVEAGEWTELAPLGPSDAWPSAREAHTLVLLGTRLLLGGGMRKVFFGGTAGTFQTSMWAFELAPEPGSTAPRWSLLNGSAPPLAEAAALSPSHMDGRASGTVLRIGGYEPAGLRLADPHLMQLVNSSTGSWRAARGNGTIIGGGGYAAAPPARLAHAFAQEGHQLYVFGGRCDDAQITSSCYLGDLWQSSFIYPALSKEAVEKIFSDFVPAAWEQLAMAVPVLEAAGVASGSRAVPVAAGAAAAAAAALVARRARPSARAAAIVAVIDASNTSAALAAASVQAVAARQRLQLALTGGKPETDPATIAARAAERASRLALANATDAAAEAPQLLVFGGLHGEGKGRAGDMWLWDMLAGRWKAVAGADAVDMAAAESPAEDGSDGTPSNRGAMASAVVAAGSLSAECSGGGGGAVITPARPRVYMFGGFTFRGYSDQLWYFEHSGAGWKRVPTPAAAAPAPAPTPLPLTVGATPAPTPSAVAYPKARDGHSLVVVGRELWMFGGEDLWGVNGDLWSYDLCSGAWGALPDFYTKVPSRRFFHAAAADPDPTRHDPTFFVHGGRSGRAAASPLLGDLWAFDTRATHRVAGWKELKASSWSQPTARYGHGFAATWSAAEGTKLWVFGGHNGRGFLNDMWVFRLATSGWLMVKPLRAGHAPLARSFPGLVPFGGRLYIFGGYNAALGAAMTEHDDSYTAALQSIISGGGGGSGGNNASNMSHLLGPPPNITGAGFFRDFWVFSLPNMSLSTSVAPPRSGSFAGAGCACSELCPSAGDGVCDDGGAGYAFRLCPLGSDCADCGPSSRNRSKAAGNASFVACPTPPPVPPPPPPNTMSVIAATLGVAAALALGTALKILPQFAALRSRMRPGLLIQRLRGKKVVPVATRGGPAADGGGYYSGGSRYSDDGESDPEVGPPVQAWQDKPSPQNPATEGAAPGKPAPVLQSKRAGRRKPGRKPFPYPYNPAASQRKL